MSAIYANLARLLARLPATTGALSVELGVRQRTVCHWLRELAASGIVARGEFRQRDGRLWVLSEARVLPRVGWRYACHGLERFARAYLALQRRQTTDSLAERLGVHRRTASDIVLHMRRAGLVRVAGWELRRQNLTPVYDRLVQARDAARPARVPREVSNAAYWQRRRLGMAGSRGAGQGAAL